jgi:hypothetical protein
LEEPLKVASAGLFGLSQIAIALVLLVMMYFRPQGLLGELEADEHLLLRRLRRTLDRSGTSLPSPSKR